MEIVDRFISNLRKRNPYVFKGSDEACCLVIMKGVLYGAIMEVYNEGYRQGKKYGSLSVRDRIKWIEWESGG